MVVRKHLSKFTQNYPSERKDYEKTHQRPVEENREKLEKSPKNKHDLRKLPSQESARHKVRAA